VLRAAWPVVAAVLPAVLLKGGGDAMRHHRTESDSACCMSDSVQCQGDVIRHYALSTVLTVVCCKLRGPVVPAALPAVLSKEFVIKGFRVHQPEDHLTVLC
jgi:hypothetical protein